MNEPTRKLELLVEEEDGVVRLLSPAVGWFTCAADRGEVLTAGAPAGVLRALEVSSALVVPKGVAGRVVNSRPERVSEPVGHRSVLYELAPLSSDAVQDGEAEEGATDGRDVLAYRTPHGGRFWHRPGPRDPAFVEAGDTLEAGTIVGLIEVMKTFTHLHYEPGGRLPERAKVVRLLIGDGDEVTSGQALIELEPA